MSTSGTREWSQASDNVWLGCKHRCRYCYARANAVRRGLCPSFDAWGTSYYGPNKLDPARGGRRGYGVDPPAVVMFPTTHDIEPDNLDRVADAICRNLELGYNLLIVTKGDIECVADLASEFMADREQIEWRFSIGSLDDDDLSYWEPGAPEAIQRVAALVGVHYKGYRTSVSAEPNLAGVEVYELVEHVERYADEIWIGKLNGIKYRCPPGTDPKRIEQVEAGQTDEAVRMIHGMLHDHPKVRWKDSYRKVLGEAVGGRQ